MVEPDPLALLADIELPAAPDGAEPLAAALVLLVLVVATVALVRLMRRRRRAPDAPAARGPVPAAEALARLDALESAWHAGEVAHREAGYRLCTIVRIGLGLPRLDPACPPPGVSPGEWAIPVRDLERLRYAPSGSDLDASVFDRARAWLGRGEARGA